MNDTQYKVVFQLSDNDTFVQKSLIRQLSNLMETLEPIAIEVVAHSYGVDLLLKDCAFKTHVQALKDNGVDFIVCEKTLDREKLDTSAFIPNIKTVKGGLAHIIKRQTEGWSYIKAGI
ncbi:MAG TPA: DsrE family protein [Chryseosolibacter sp.]|nr:DsrE family protein [Chryseosolibacter sp.]